MSSPVDQLNQHPAAEQFQHISRAWDKKAQCPVARIKPAELYVAKGKERICTVLGSCVAVCLFDVDSGIGGMNHFLLPQDPQGTARMGDLQFGAQAMKRLIWELIAAGAARNRLQAKVFGGASIMQSESEIGQQNADFARQYLQENDMEILAEDFGGEHPRQVLMEVDSGRIKVRRLRTLVNGSVARREGAMLAENG